MACLVGWTLNSLSRRELRIRFQTAFTEIHTFIFVFFIDPDAKGDPNQQPGQQAGYEYPEEYRQQSNDLHAGEASSLWIGTANRPHIPTTPCTEMAPTGSSTLSLSSDTIDNTTSRPPTAPIRVAPIGVGASGSAVIETRPASAPFSAMVRSALPNHDRARISASTNPPAAAILVLTNTSATAFAICRENSSRLPSQYSPTSLPVPHPPITMLLTRLQPCCMFSSFAPLILHSIPSTPQQPGFKQLTAVCVPELIRTVKTTRYDSVPGWGALRWCTIWPVCPSLVVQTPKIAHCRRFDAGLLRRSRVSTGYDR